MALLRPDRGSPFGTTPPPIARRRAAFRELLAEFEAKHGFRPKEFVSAGRGV
jgi:hypothetical protein